jgi:nucleotide-binding universal stress UspA family protein
MKTILVPLDGSTVAEQALPYARRLASLLMARVHLLIVLTAEQKQRMIARYAATPDGASSRDETDWHWERRARAELTRATETYLAEQTQALRAAGLDATFEVASGAPAERIVDIAAGEPAALIAMATHGYSGLQRWSLGSVADKVLQAATTPIFLVRTIAQPPAVPWSLQRVMVPLDGSALAEQALPPAIELATHAQAELLLFHAVSPPLKYVPDLAPFHRAPSTIEFPLPGHQQALDQLQAVVERWQPHGIAVLPVVASGEPAQEIIDEAARQHVDLIVLATHGYSGLRRWALGSVADKLLHATNTPLLLVRSLHV